MLHAVPMAMATLGTLVLPHQAFRIRCQLLVHEMGKSREKGKETLPYPKLLHTFASNISPGMNDTPLPREAPPRLSQSVTAKESWRRLNSETSIHPMEYMSQEGYDKLVAELRELERQVPVVKDAIAEARAQGDLSENFEYHAAKREQGKLLSRIRFKQRILQFARVIDTSRLNADAVGLLTTVSLTNLKNGMHMDYQIVSPHEANFAEKKISIKSPIAQALLGKKAGDVVEVRVPAGTLNLRIEQIELKQQAF